MGTAAVLLAVYLPCVTGSASPVATAATAVGGLGPPSLTLGTTTTRAVSPRPEDRSRSRVAAAKRWGVNIHWVECQAHAPCPADLGPSGGPMPGEPEQLGAKHRRPFSQQPQPLRFLC